MRDWLACPTQQHCKATETPSPRSEQSWVCDSAIHHHALEAVILHRAETLFCRYLPLAAGDIPLYELTYGWTFQWHSKKKARILPLLPCFSVSKWKPSKMFRLQVKNTVGMSPCLKRKNAAEQAWHLQGNKAIKHFISEPEVIAKHLCTLAPKGPGTNPSLSRLQLTSA